MDEPLPSAALRKWIDPLADQFEQAWQTGRRPALAEFLAGAPPERRGPLARELVAIDLEYRSQRQESPRLEEYAAEHPELLESGGLLPDSLVLVADKWSQRGSSADPAATLPFDDATAGDLPAPRRPRVLGKFQLLEVLGEGAFGTVYKARDAELAVTRAIKVPRRQALTPRDRERFLHEARAAAQLVHPNIVPVHEAVQRGELSYIVTDLIEGETLDVWRARARPDFAASAQLVAEVADALDYAHERGIVHRDVKPSNILIDAEGGPHVTDFGLARSGEADVLATSAGHILGTPAYMSPEQAAGRSDEADARSDVYSLGIVLYELLAGELPFRGDYGAVLEQARNEDPRPPRQLVSAIPADLETICLKCLAKLPTARYATAGELAEDLRRWLEGYPIHARPVTWIEWTWRWCLRNPKLGSAYAAVGLLIVAVVAISVWFGVSQSIARGNLERQLVVERLQQVWLGPRRDGWSRAAWKLVGEAAAYRTDEDLRDYAAATLDGIDAEQAHIFEGSASSVAFDPSGKRVAFGGYWQSQGKPEESRARIWQLDQAAPREAGLAEAGPVAFDASGRALQLACTGDTTLRLWDLDRNLLLRTLDFPRVVRALGPVDPPASAVLTPGARFAAARRTFRSGGPDNLAVWDAERGTLVRTFAFPATALALAPDGSLLAAGNSAGEIRVWRLPSGEELCTLQAQRMQIESLAFHPNPARRPKSGGSEGELEDPWLLAAGDAGGSVTIWNPTSRQPTAFCRGGQHAVYALAFSSDGATLASGGRWEVRLWDVATGREQYLLRGHTFKRVFDVVRGLAFSPDGGRLAVASEPGQVPGSAHLFTVEFGRGVRRLRGLSSELSKFVLSPDGRFAAALSHQWQIGVWRLADGSLVRLLNPPSGFFVDNAGLAFSRDGTKLAFSAGNSARVWDLATGGELDEWQLPPGLQDSLAFRAGGELALLRYETASGELAPFSGVNYRDHPRVCRVRTLLPGGTLRVEREVLDLPCHVMRLGLSPEADYFVGIGQTRPGKDPEAYLAGAWEVSTGKGETATGLFGEIVTGRNGPVGVSRPPEVVSFSPGGRALDRFDGDFNSLFYFDAELRLMAGKPRAVGGGVPSGVTLSQGDPWQPMVCLGIGGEVLGAQFTKDGRTVVWGNLDGTLCVCDLETARKKLAAAGLAWEPLAGEREK